MRAGMLQRPKAAVEALMQRAATTVLGRWMKIALDRVTRGGAVLAMGLRDRADLISPRLQGPGLSTTARRARLCWHDGRAVEMAAAILAKRRDACAITVTSKNGTTQAARSLNGGHAADRTDGAYNPGAMTGRELRLAFLRRFLASSAALDCPD